jgi:hypothetical protein
MSLAPGWRAVGSGLICFIAAEVRSGSHGSQRHQEDSSPIGCLDRWVSKARVQAPRRLGLEGPAGGGQGAIHAWVDQDARDIRFLCGSRPLTPRWCVEQSGAMSACFAATVLDVSAVVKRPPRCRHGQATAAAWAGHQCWRRNGRMTWSAWIWSSSASTWAWSDRRLARRADTISG